MVYFESKGIVESRRDDELETEKGAENTRNNSGFPFSRLWIISLMRFNHSYLYLTISINLSINLLPI